MADLNYLANQILDIERRELILESALKCKTEKEKISFYENDFDTRGFEDVGYDAWEATIYEFLEANEINDEDGCWKQWFESKFEPPTSLRNKLISSLKETDPERFKAYEEGQKWSQRMMVEFKKEYPNAIELIKNYKLYQFSCWFEEPDNFFYKLFIQDNYLIKNRVDKALKAIDLEDKSKLQKILELKRKENKLISI